MAQINTNTYNDYNISYQFFHNGSIYKISSDMRVSSENIFQIKHQTTKNMLIPLCKNTSDRYNFNILIIISIDCNIYIESELYNLAHGEN